MAVTSLVVKLTVTSALLALLKVTVNSAGAPSVTGSALTILTVGTSELSSKIVPVVETFKFLVLFV